MFGDGFTERGGEIVAPAQVLSPVEALAQHGADGVVAVGAPGLQGAGNRGADRATRLAGYLG